VVAAALGPDPWPPACSPLSSGRHAECWPVDSRLSWPTSSGGIWRSRRCTTSARCRSPSPRTPRSHADPSPASGSASDETNITTERQSFELRTDRLGVVTQRSALTVRRSVELWPAPRRHRERSRPAPPTRPTNADGCVTVAGARTRWTGPAGPPPPRRGTTGWPQRCCGISTVLTRRSRRSVAARCPVDPRGWALWSAGEEMHAQPGPGRHHPDPA
jgi:hypothetical protein